MGPRAPSGADTVSQPQPLPCPWCGSNDWAVPRFDYNKGGLSANFWYWVRCQSCGARSGRMQTRDEAIAAWNRVAARGSKEGAR